MPAIRNYEIALKDYVDHYISLQESERDKDYAAIMQLINNIADGVSVNVNAEGSGLVFDTQKSALVHSNQLSPQMTSDGQTGVGSGMYIPTVKWDRNGHITGVTANKLDDEVKQNSMNGVLSGAVYAAISAERQRAEAAEASAVQTALAAGTEYSFIATLSKTAWSDTKTQSIYNAKFTGAETELVRVDFEEYEAYANGVYADSSSAGALLFKCETVPSMDLRVKVIVSATVRV